MRFESGQLRRVDLLVYLLWILILFYAVIGFWGHTYDDVYLAYVYAKNILGGFGFVFNPGEKVLGTPVPLFVLLLVSFKSILPFTIPQVGSIISGTSLALAGLAAYGIGKLSSQRLLGFIAGIFIVFNPFTVLVLGGEAPLYLCFVMWSIYLYLRGWPHVTAFLLGLALMNRSEAVVPIGLLLGYDFYKKRKLPWSMGFVTLGTVMPWVVYATLEFGTPVTGSFTARISQVPAGLPRYPIGLWRWTRDIIVRNNPYLLSLAPLMALGLCSLIWTRTSWRLVAAWAVLQTIFYSCLPIPFYPWYAAQAGVLSAVLLALGAVEVPELLRGTARSLRLLSEKIEREKTATYYLARKWSGAFISTVAGCAILVLFSASASMRSVVQYQRFIPHHPSNKIYQETGKWFRANSEPDARIAYLEIGQIAFYADRYIIDTLGLVTPGAAKQVAVLNWPWVFEKYKPTYIIYNDMFRDWIGPVLDRPWFRSGFEEVQRISEPGYPVPLVIYKAKPGIIFPEPSEPEIIQTRHDGAVGEIFGDNTIGQTFKAAGNGLSGVELLFGAFARKNTGSISISLLDDKKEQLYEVRFPAAEIQDNSWKHFDFPPVRDSAGKLFALRISSSDSSPGNAVTVWKTREANLVPEGHLHYAGKRMEGTLSFRTYVTAQ